MKYRHTFRKDSQRSKGYYENLCKEFSIAFAEFLKEERGIEVAAFDYVKQDIRGVPSICAFDSRHCVSYQRHFADMKEMREFMEGFLVAKGIRHA